MRFTSKTQTKVLAIVRVFETSRPLGNFAAYAVLDDGAGVSYGISQFTHRSGSLLAVIENYLKAGGSIGRQVFVGLLPLLRRRDADAISQIARNTHFENALKAAARSHEMRAAQTLTARDLYLKPAIERCARLGMVLPLSLAVVYDSMIHGSWRRLSDSIKVRCPADGGSEKEWVTAYVRKRHAWLTASPRLAKTGYRTRFFLEQIMAGRWELELPFCVHGVLLTETLLFPARAAKNSAAEPAISSSETTPADIGPEVTEYLSEASLREDLTVPSLRNTQPPNHHRKTPFEIAEENVARAARRYDRVEAVVKTVITRKDAAKSLWTTIVGTVWQTAWAVAGFAYGIPPSIWLSAAVLVGLLAAVYLYRQITLAKIRERAS